MTELTRRVAILRDVDVWFGERGFGLVLSVEDGKYWANLFSKDGLIVTVPRYGGGRSPEEAAERARRRYKVEQEGLDPEQPDR